MMLLNFSNPVIDSNVLTAKLDWLSLWSIFLLFWRGDSFATTASANKFSFKKKNHYKQSILMHLIYCLYLFHFKQLSRSISRKWMKMRKVASPLKWISPFFSRSVCSPFHFRCYLHPPFYPNLLFQWHRNLLCIYRIDIYVFNMWVRFTIINTIVCELILKCISHIWNVNSWWKPYTHTNCTYIVYKSQSL